jgi:O-acetyl-ADP-ribose deacetylase (regulator of RNase III)
MFYRSQSGFWSSLTRPGLLAKLSTMANRAEQPEALAELVVAGTTLRVVLADITRLEVDVIVNAANTSLLGGGGVDGAIHEAAGPALLDECHQIVARQGGCDTGEAVITSAGELSASWVVHTVGPVWTGQNHELQDSQLTACYRNSLMLANKNCATSIAFPNISTGVYHFPKERAVVVTLRAVLAKVEAGTSIAEILFCCFDQENADLYAATLLGP